MKNLWFLPLFLLTASLTLAQKQEPRLVLPVGHTSGVISAVFSPDGKLALTASNDNTARIWDVSTGKELQVLIGNNYCIESAVFSPDGQLVLTTARWDKTARIFEVATGKERQVLSGHNQRVNSAVFSLDGKLALTASWDNTARIFEVATGKELEVLKGHTHYVRSALFSQDCKHALTAGDTTARIFEVATGKELQVLSGHTDWVNSAVFSPDGKLALTASNDNTARIWDAATGKELQVLSGHTDGVASAVFSPDGALVLTESGSTAHIFEVATGKELQVLEHTSWVTSAVFSADGKWAFTVSSDYTAVLRSRARIFEVATGKELQVLRWHSLEGGSAILSPDGQLVLTTASEDNTARIFEIATGKERQVLSGHTSRITSAIFSPDGKWGLTASDNTARIFEVTTGKVLQVLKGHTDYVHSAVFSPDGTLALTAGDTTARIFEVATGKALQVLSGHSTATGVYSAVFSPDGTLALMASDTTACIFEVATGKELKVLSGHAYYVRSAVFSPDGTLALTANEDNTARLWDVSTGKELQVLSEHTSWVTSAIFSSDGTLALTASDNTARIFEVTTGKVLQVLKGHTDYVHSAVFSPDGTLALTASRDKTARIFEVATGKELQVLKGHTREVISAVFSPDGRHVLTTGLDHKTILWDVATGKALYTRLQLEENDWLVYDEHYRFDGTPGAIEKLYFVCGLEVVELSQVKQSLRVRNLVEKILNKEDLSGYKKLSDLNICGKLPLIETIGNEDEFAYTVQRRLAPLIRIEVLLDKKVIKTIDPNTLSWNNNKTTLRLSQEEIRSFFEPGKENKVKVQAIANVDGVEIPDRGVVVTIEDLRERKKPTFYGVFLGVNEYNDESLALNFPVNDALSLSKTMEEGVSALLDQQWVKIYNIHSDYSLEKNNGFGSPTLNTLRRALQEIAEKAEPQDVLFLFLAGHGTMGDNTHKKFTFLTSEATVDTPIGITTDTLFSWISTEGPFKLKANKAILILDACNSGQLLNDVAMRSDNDEEEQRQRQLDHLSDRSGLFILSAAAPNKSAYEIPKLEHGLLTYSLLRVLKQNNAIYENESFVNMTKWFYETSRDLSKLTEEFKLDQEATPSGTGDFQLLKVTKEMRQHIRLAEEKQILFFESVENEKEELPDLDLKKRLEKKMEVSALFRARFYKTDKYDEQGVLVKIKYSLKGKKIQCRILIFQKNVKQKQLTLSNATGSWETLENDIIEALVKWIGN